MTLTDEKHSLLLRQFRAFYKEVLRLKRQVAPTGLVPVDADAGSPGDEEDQQVRPVVTAVRQRLLMLLDQQEAEARKAGGMLAHAHYKEAEYAFVALADEIFLTLDWGGRALWQANLLETERFRSQVAGERFFEKANALLTDHDTLQVEQAKIYLMALALGFQGRYRGEDGGADALGYYRQQLFAFIARREPAFSHGATALFPEAYEYTLGQGRPDNLPHPRRWLWGVAGVALGLLFVSIILWQHLADDVVALLRAF